MATYQRGFKLGILPERKIDKRALATGYTFLVLMVLLSDQHRTFVSGQDFAETVPRYGIDSAAQLEAGAGTHQSGEAGGEAEAASSRAGFRTTQADRTS